MTLEEWLEKHKGYRPREEMIRRWKLAGLIVDALYEQRDEILQAYATNPESLADGTLHRRIR